MDLPMEMVLIKDEEDYDALPVNKWEEREGGGLGKSGGGTVGGEWGREDKKEKKCE